MPESLKPVQIGSLFVEATDGSLPPARLSEIRDLIKTANVDSVGLTAEERMQASRALVELRQIVSLALVGADPNEHLTKIAQADEVQFLNDIKPWNDVVKLIPSSRKEFEDRKMSRNELIGIKAELDRLYQQLLTNRRLVTTGSQRVDALIEWVKSTQQTQIRLIDDLAADKDPQIMTLEEIVEELTTWNTYDSSPRAQQLWGAYEKQYGSTSPQMNEQRRNRLINKAATVWAAIKATSGKVDFATNINMVWQPFQAKNGTVESIALGYFFRQKNRGEAVDSNSVLRGSVEVNTRAIDMWDYIVSRVMGKKGSLGINQAVKILPNGAYADATDRFVVRFPAESEPEYQARLMRIYELDNQSNFDYSHLSGDMVKNFEEQVTLIFQDLGPLAGELLLFYKTFGAKSSGYIPWLMRGATRGHGFKYGEQERTDESAYVNPIALRLYQATRYFGFQNARYMMITQLLPRDLLFKIITENSKGEAKKKTASGFYDLMDKWFFSRWHIRPEEMPWIKETRKLFAGNTPTINIDGNLFPLLPELYANVLKLEARRRQLKQGLDDGSISIDKFNAGVEELVKAHSKEGYFDYGSLTEAGGDSSLRLDALLGSRQLIAGPSSQKFELDHYEIASKAMTKMFDTFDKPLKKEMSAEEVAKIMSDWASSIIGKAKLVPGPHQQLFAPMTCLLLTNALYAFEDSHISGKVNELYAEVIHSLDEAGGLPPFVMEDVVKLMGGNKRKAPDYCVNREYFWARRSYRRALKLHRGRLATGLAAFISNRFGPLPELEAPFVEEEEVSKDTTKKE